MSGRGSGFRETGGFGDPVLIQASWARRLTGVFPLISMDKGDLLEPAIYTLEGCRASAPQAIAGSQSEDVVPCHG